MKRFFIVTVIALIGLTLHAQDTLTQDTLAQAKLPVLPNTGTEDVDAVSTHSFTIQILGLDYSYEQRLGGDFSMIFRAGILPGEIDIYSSPDLGQDLYANMVLGIAIEPRYYTNFDRRTRLGKSTFKNSADFVSIRLSGGLYDGYMRDFVASITPMYGIRRVWGKHWFGEFTTGINFHYTHELNLGLHLQYRLGFVF